MTNISVNKDFLKKKMTVSLSCNNPYSKYLKVTTTTTTEYFAANGLYYSPMQEVRLNISYRFGSMKETIKRVQRGITNDDVKSGSDSGSSGI